MNQSKLDVASSWLSRTCSVFEHPTGSRILWSPTKALFPLKHEFPSLENRNKNARIATLRPETPNLSPKYKPQATQKIQNSVLPQTMRNQRKHASAVNWDHSLLCTSITPWNLKHRNLSYPRGLKILTEMLILLLLAPPSEVNQIEQPDSHHESWSTAQQIKDRRGSDNNNECKTSRSLLSAGTAWNPGALAS